MLTLNTDSATPLYRQLSTRIRQRILAGTLAADTRLPSVRVLAAELAVSRNTVEGAYQELYAEGYLYSKPRSGFFVSPLDHGLVPGVITPPRRSARPSPPAPPPLYDFHPAHLDPHSFPAALWRKCFLDVVRASAVELTGYGDPQGEWRLRSAIRQYLERSRGVHCEPDQVVICSGLQQGLETVIGLVRHQHRVVAVEEPGYHLPRQVFRNHGFTVRPVPVSPAGLDPDRLAASGSSLAYVTPSHQLPMGYVMPVAARLKLLEWAAAGNNLILEDDYDSELRYHGTPIPSLQGLQPDGNIVYLGTFSKVLSPALRLSYMVLPRRLLDSYRERYCGYFSTVPLLEQKTMALFMEQGYWERHLRRMRTLYRKKHDAMLKAVRERFPPDATVIGQGAGLHMVLRLPADAAAEADIIERAAQQRVQLFPFSTFCAADEPDGTHLLLGFGGMTVAEIERGVALLAHVCR